MTTLLGSASKLHRTLHCPASVHLPVGRELPEAAKKAGERGTSLHTVGELLGSGKTLADILPNIPEQHRKEAAKLDWSHYPGLVPHARREIAFAHHGVTGAVRVLGESIGREYVVEDQHETPGTMDVVIPGYRVVEVYDLKTGRTPVPPAGENPQLLLGALCAVESICPSADAAVVGIATIEKGAVRVTDQATVTREDLAAFEQRIVKAQRVALQVVQDIAEHRQPGVTPGAHCRYCDARCEFAR